jgi:hypothetical protein
LAAVGVSLRRQSGQFTRLLADPAAEIGQFPQHRRHLQVIPLHRRASHTLQSRSTPPARRRGVGQTSGDPLNGVLYGRALLRQAADGGSVSLE